MKTRGYKSTKSTLLMKKIADIDHAISLDNINIHMRRCGQCLASELASVV